MGEGHEPYGRVCGMLMRCRICGQRPCAGWRTAHGSRERGDDDVVPVGVLEHESHRGHPGRHRDDHVSRSRMARVERAAAEGRGRGRDAGPWMPLAIRVESRPASGLVGQCGRRSVGQRHAQPSAPGRWVLTGDPGPVRSRLDGHRADLLTVFEDGRWISGCDVQGIDRHGPSALDGRFRGRRRRRWRRRRRLGRAHGRWR